MGPDAGWKPHESIEETREIMNTVFFKKENTFGIVIKESGKFIGSIGLDKEPKRENDKALMLGYAIGEDYWGCGYTSEAALALIEYGFKTLGMELISAYCYPFNERSKSVIKKLGFKYEGKLSMCQKRFDGLVLDEECYALSAEDYFRPRN